MDLTLILLTVVVLGAILLVVYIKTNSGGITFIEHSPLNSLRGCGRAVKKLKKIMGGC